MSQTKFFNKLAIFLTMTRKTTSCVTVSTLMKMAFAEKVAHRSRKANRAASMATATLRTTLELFTLNVSVLGTGALVRLNNKNIVES